jgi:hypothetical protein
MVRQATTEIVSTSNRTMPLSPTAVVAHPGIAKFDPARITTAADATRQANPDVMVADTSSRTRTKSLKTATARNPCIKSIEDWPM